MKGGKTASPPRTLTFGVAAHIHYLEFSVGILEPLLRRSDSLLHTLCLGHRRRFSSLGSRALVFALAEECLQLQTQIQVEGRARIMNSSSSIVIIVTSPSLSSPRRSDQPYATVSVTSLGRVLCTNALCCATQETLDTVLLA